MFEKIFGGSTYIAQTKALDAAALRHQVISHNLANANTPNFKRQTVQFEGELSRALVCAKSGTPRCGEELDAVTPRVVAVRGTSTRLDGNNVNLESEAVDMAENTLRYEVLSQSVGGFFGALKTVINGR
jgi:flagellar basal-body rod protein FlgB